MNNMELGILLNFILWIVVIPAIVIIGVWVCVVLFEASEIAKDNIRARSGRDASPHPSQASEDADERYRKTA